MRPVSNQSSNWPGRTEATHAGHTLVALAWVLLALVAAIASTRMGAVAAQAVEPSWSPLVDRAALLDEGQHSSASGDVARLNQSGIPAQIVTELTGYGRDEAAARADDIRRDNGVESRPGADDGLVIYASVSPTNPDEVVIVVSAGTRALPAGGFTTGDLDTIRETIIGPQLAAGHPARAIVYSMREMLYQQVFTPPPAQPLEPSRQDQRDTLQVAALFLSIAAGALVLLATRSRFWHVAVLSGLAIAGGIFALAVMFQSGLAMACSIALLVLVATLAIRRDASKAPPAVRMLAVTPRAPGKFRSAAR